MRIGVISLPLSAAGTVPLHDLIRILSPLTDKLSVLTGGDAYERLKNDGNLRVKEVVHFRVGNASSRIIRHLTTQLTIAWSLLTEFSDVGFWVFFIGGDGLVIPLLAARLTGRKTILVLAGSGSLTQRAYGDPLEGLTRATSVLACALSNRIALYSLRLKSEWRLERYSSKIVIANHHFPDYDMFRIRRLFVDRCNTIGYVGRLSKEKGVMNLIRAVPHLMSSKPGIGLTIAGDGPCRRAVLDFLNEQGLEKKVKVLGWISHDQLPELLNELKLVVIPSWTEGLPNVMLEAMACGTPVLAMPVGAIPDVIMDGETGFILEDNSPACIAKSISFVLESSKLEGVSEKAHSVVMRDFQYKKAVSTWESIIDGINKE